MEVSLSGAHTGDRTSDRQIDDLHTDYRRTGDRRLRDQLVDHYLEYARSLARAMYRGGEPLEDLEQVACEMLVCAVDRFEPERGIPFRGYARVVILGALKRHYRDHGWSMRVPRAVHDQLPGVAAAAESLQHELGRPPTQSEVANRANVGRDVLRTISQATDARRVTSLDAPALGGDQAAGDRYGRPDKGFDRIENHLDLQDAMSDLPQADIRVLQEYYVDECSQSVIAERRGVSQMQISRRLSRITARLRTSMAAVG